MGRHTVEPIRRSISVPWDREAAFRRFTSDFDRWWPSGTHSIGRHLVDRVVFEAHPGGRIYEQLKDGRRFLWGTVTAWNPPSSVSFTWHPAQESHDAQQVDVSFAPDAEGTRVTLTSSGWDRMRPDASRHRKGYDLGWGSILHVYGERRGAVFFVFALITLAISLFLRVTGRFETEIAKAPGLIVDASK